MKVTSKNMQVTSEAYNLLLMTRFLFSIPQNNDI